MPPKFATYFTFSEFNGGVRATLDEFRAELSRFNGPAVVYVCSVMNAVTRDWQGHSNVEAHEELVRNSFAPQISERIIADMRNAQNPRGVYHRQQLLFVCKEAFALCPKSGGKDPMNPPGGGELGRVLLMANDLLPKRVTGPAPTAEQMINVMSEFIPIAEASGFYKAMHKLLRSRIMLDRFFPNGGHEIRRVFQQTTGVGLDEYFALCFATLCRYLELDLKAYQRDQSTFVLTPLWFRTTQIPAVVVENFLAEISATADDFKDLLQRKEWALNDFTCFRSKPMFKSDDAYFLLDPLFLAEKSEAGVFWNVNRGLPPSSRLQFHQDWGLAFERYVNWLIAESVDGSLNRFLPNPKFSDTGEEVCDALLFCGDSVVFIESKGATFTGEAKYGADPLRLREEIEEKFIQTEGRRKGIGQLAARIEEAFSRKNPRGIEGVDTSKVSKIFPVLVARDDIGAALVMNAYLASRFRDLFHRKSVLVTVTPPFSLSAQDLEMICGYLAVASLADLLEERYRRDPALLSSFWLVDNPIISQIGERECRALAEESSCYFRDVESRLFFGRPGA